MLLETSPLLTHIKANIKERRDAVLAEAKYVSRRGVSVSRPANVCEHDPSDG